MLCRCATWAMSSQDFSNLRTAHHSYSCALSAFGARTAPGINPYRIGRFSRGPVPNASKRHFRSANLGSPGPLSGKATQGFQSESYLGGWWCKSQARRSTGDVLGGLPPEKSRGLWGGPAQRQRTGVGRIRSCCEGWTGLDDCCEEGWQVALGVERGAEALDSAWRRADLRQSNVQRQREVSEIVQ